MNTLRSDRLSQAIFSLVLGLFFAGGMLLALVGLSAYPAFAQGSCTVNAGGGGSHATIQGAINAGAGVCDTIVLSAGTFNESLTIGRSLTLQGAGKTATIIDGSAANRVVTISGSNSVVKLYNLRITGGNATSAPSNPRFGGGILVAGGATLHGETIQIDQNVANTGANTGFGGGLSVRDGSTHLTRTMIFSNGAKAPFIGGSGEGGGLYIAGNLGAGRAILTMVDSQIMDNAAHAAPTGVHGRGGGLFVGASNDTQISLSGNTWRGNIARSSISSAEDGEGGAIAVMQPALVTISNDNFYDNIANDANALGTGDDAIGGAISLNPASGRITATLMGLTLINNVAKTKTGTNAVGQGGGIFSNEAMVTLKGSKLYDNKADTSGEITGEGGGLHIRGFANDNLEYTIVNTVLGGNSVAGGDGAALYINHGSAGIQGLVKVIHTTIADDTLNGDEAIVFEGGDASDRLRITDTIISNHRVGLHNRNTNGTASGRYILFFDNTFNTMGSLGGLEGNIDGLDPLYLNPAGNDYHLGIGSAAIDQGVNAGITDDIDSDARPQGSGFDIGADEAAAKLEISKSGPSASPIPINYTITVTNSGSLTATNLLITDTIPAGATYNSGGTLVGNEVQWMVAELKTGNTWQGTFSVKTDQPTVTNDAYRVTADGNISATGTVTVTTRVYHIYLPMLLKE